MMHLAIDSKLSSCDLIVLGADGNGCTVGQLSAAAAWYDSFSGGGRPLLRKTSSG